MTSVIVKKKKRRDTDLKTHREEHHVETEADVGIMGL